MSMQNVKHLSLHSSHAVGTGTRGSLAEGANAYTPPFVM
jgi:hypothetical protein